VLVCADSHDLEAKLTLCRSSAVEVQELAKHREWTALLHYDLMFLSEWTQHDCTASNVKMSLKEPVHGGH
jgi:hypothetical protein